MDVDILKDEDGFLFLDGEFYDTNRDDGDDEIDLNVPFRRVIGVGKSSDSINGDNNRLGIYKRLERFPNGYDENEGFILFRLENESLYCIRQSCSLCEFKNGCDPTIEVRDSENDFKLIKEFK